MIKFTKLSSLQDLFLHIYTTRILNLNIKYNILPIMSFVVDVYRACCCYDGVHAIC